MRAAARGWAAGGSPGAPRRRPRIGRPAASARGKGAHGRTDHPSEEPRPRLGRCAEIGGGKPRLPRTRRFFRSVGGSRDGLGPVRGIAGPSRVTEQESGGYRWRSRLRRRERGEARGAGGGARGRPEPGGEALEVDRGRGRHVLQVGPGQPAVAAAAQAEGAHPLRDRALDPGPPRVGAPALLGREPPAGRPERLVLRPRLQPQVPGLCSARVHRGRAGQAPQSASRNITETYGAPAWSTCGLQAEDSLPCGQRTRSCVPVDLEAVERVAALDLGLPGRVRPRRADQVDARASSRLAHQQLGVDVGRVDQVLGRARGPCRPGPRGSRRCTAPRARWRRSSSRA